MDDASGNTADAGRPLWLGSLARRGVGRAGEGWAEPPSEEAPRWLGSAARRGEQQRSPGPRRDPGAPAWLGSMARRRLAPEPGRTVVELSERREQAAAPPPAAHTVVGELGMTLRVA